MLYALFYYSCLVALIIGEIKVFYIGNIYSWLFLILAMVLFSLVSDTISKEAKSSGMRRLMIISLFMIFIIFLFIDLVDFIFPMAKGYITEIFGLIVIVILVYCAIIGFILLIKSGKRKLSAKRMNEEQS